MAETNNQSTMSSSHDQRFTRTEVADAIKNSTATPLFVADGTALEIGTKIRALGNKQISVVVLS